VFLTLCGRLAGRIEVLFVVLFPDFLLRCRFGASTDVVLYPIVLSGMD
jgi:hypothetical protein